MLADLPWLLDSNHWLWVLGVVGCIIVGKTVVIWLLAIALKHPCRVSIAAGLCLAQIGEFSFVIGAEAMNTNLLNNDIFQLMMCSSLITLLLSPVLIGKSRGIAKRIDALLGRDPQIETDYSGNELHNHVVVIGYGVAGRNVVRDLLETGQQVIVIDMGPIGIKQAREDGAFSLLGNAQRRDVLEHAGIQSAKLVVSTLPDYRSSVQTIQQVRAFAGEVPIVARARYSIHSEQASDVFLQFGVVVQ